jgi:hypothetical protein
MTDTTTLRGAARQGELKVINIACLYPQHFARILSGVKRTEWRKRKGPDSRLDAVKPGEELILLECRSTRTLRTRVTRIRRHRDLTGYVYAIQFSRPELTVSTLPHLQGWHRRASL